MFKNEELIIFKKEDIGPGADLRDICLFGVDLSGVDLSGAILRRTNLNFSNLRDANLSDADLSGARLMNAKLNRADLSGACLTDADLTDADLFGAILTNAKGLPPMVCPEKGSYIAYKKARCLGNYLTSVIITLEIPETAKRSSATSNKCRCNEAKVVSIESLDGTKKYEKAVSSFDHEFVYEVGKTVKVDDFNDDRWAECTTGIHHFMTREEAEEYWF